MRRRSPYKYFRERKWAECFLDGSILFRSLAYFRDYEDGNVREDRNEGTAVFRPADGLITNNVTRGTTFTLPNSASESAAKQEEIFVFCMSRSLTDELRETFEASVVAEILDIPAFCRRVTETLPVKATFPGPNGKTRIGHRVKYYGETEGSAPRWALPDMIATSKLDTYTWQDEFRLVFTLTDAFAFENVDTRLVQGNPSEAVNPSEHRTFQVKITNLREICRLHEF